MAKKDFSQIKTGRADTTATTGTVFAAIETGSARKGQQGTVSPQEAAERANSLRTQGRKGCKATRINMAFTPSNHDFVKTMAKLRGQTMTEFVNFALEEYAKLCPNYEEVKAFLAAQDEAITRSAEILRQTMEEESQ